MIKLLTTGAAGLLVVCLANSGAVFAQSNSGQSGKTDRMQSSQPVNSKLKIEHVEPTATMENLIDAVRELRQATVLMLTQKEPGQKRDDAVQAASGGFAAPSALQPQVLAPIHLLAAQVR